MVGGKKGAVPKFRHLFMEVWPMGALGRFESTRMYGMSISSVFAGPRQVQDPLIRARERTRFRPATI